MTNLKLTRDFAPNPNHGYNLPADTEVKSAKFGQIRVDLWQDPELGTIYRGDPPRAVGAWPDRNWRYVVKGVMSGLTATEAGAKSKGELTAWTNQSNAPTIFDGTRIVFAPGLLRHQLSPGGMARDDQMVADQHELVMRLFPADGDPDEIGVKIRPGPCLKARVEAVLFAAGEPLLLRLSRIRPDGAMAEMIACALPEGDGRGWAYVVSEPTSDRMGEWKKGSMDLRDLQTDPHTAHHVARGPDLGAAGSDAQLTRIDGPLPEAWLPETGFFAHMLEIDNYLAENDPISP